LIATPWRSRDDGTFFLVTGIYPTDSSEGRDKFLAAIGSALVFLIDWNKARKLLRTWISKNDAVRILDWAARQRSVTGPSWSSAVAS